MVVIMSRLYDLLFMLIVEYEEYISIVKLRVKIDKLHFKKRLEELHNSNLISIKQEEKYSEVFDLKII